MNIEFTIDDLVACARRELGQRRRVYSRLVMAGEMSKESADQEIALMIAIKENLENQQQPKLF
jgi:hypothetical protein